MFLVWPFLTAEDAPAFLDAVTASGRRIVYLSSAGVRDDLEEQIDPISSFHAGVEDLIERSGLEWTILRSGGMATNTLMWAEQIRAGGVVRWPYGAASRSLIHEGDIAAVAVRSLTADGHHGSKHVLTGPQALTQVEQVQAIGDAIGRPLRFEEISREAAREELLAGWADPAMVDGALDAWAEMVSEPEQVTSTVQEITGEPARTFRDWTVDHAADFDRGPGLPR